MNNISISFGKILESLLNIETITDIMIWNNEIWFTDIYKGHLRYDIEKDNKDDLDELKKNIYKIPKQISIKMELPFNNGNPFLDGELATEEFGLLRFNCIHENMIDDNHPAIAIRKSKRNLRINNKSIVDTGFCDIKFLNLMDVLIKAGCNIIIGGQTGSGKTELLRYLCRYINNNEAIITIEDTIEARLKNLYPNKNVLSLKTNNQVEMSDLIKTCLRQNPDWICISETRGKEVGYLLEAISTGHHLISTIHCDSANNIPLRILQMLKADKNNNESLYQQIFNHIDIGIYISYYNNQNGSQRQVVEVVEYYLENFKEKMHYLYRYDYHQKKISFQTINSQRIKRKILEKHVSTSKINEVFYYE